MDTRDKQLNAAIDASSAPATADANEQDTRSRDASREYADEYPAYLRLVRELPTIAPCELGDYELRHMPPGNEDSAWQNCLNSVEKYDRELCQAYREQIDTLLVFAGLFSAVVTAFAVESYQWLQDDPVDTSVKLLRDVVGLLAQNSNLTMPPTPGSTQRLSDAAVVRINSFWFLSLSLSLSAALVGILCKQWLREFERNVGQSPETALSVRYIRFQGLEYWNVGAIVASVPIILQIALAFFIIGIIELLWRLHTIVACCVTLIAGITLVFYLTTTLLPVLQYAYICMRCYVEPLRTRDYTGRRAFTEPQCAFKSAQAWLAFQFVRPVINRLLRAYGYQFSSHHPPVFVDLVLRHPDSWVTFDLNWVKCRENIHLGPRCAFESLTWIAQNLGEVHLSSWIWHCVWARWLKNRESPEDFTVVTTEIESVARSYPRIVSIGDNHTEHARLQALLFRCSLRADLPVNTAAELLLRVATVSGAGSHWTRDAVHAIRIVYRDLTIQLGDDIAVRLFRLAKLQVHAIINESHGPDLTAQFIAAIAFRDIVVILHRGTHLRDILIPAMSGLVLQWLRSRPPRRIALMGRAVFEDVIRCLVYQGYRGLGVRDLRQYRGIMFIAKLAGAVVELWPEELDEFENCPDERSVLRELLHIFSNRVPEPSQDHADAGTEPHPEPVVSADGERSNAPAPADVDAYSAAGEERADLPGGFSHADETSQLPTQAHLCIDVRMEPGADVAKTEVGVNSPTSAVARSNPVVPASPPRSPVSPDSLVSP